MCDLHEMVTLLFGGIAADQQVLVHNNQRDPLPSDSPHATLRELGVGNGDTLMLVPKDGAAGAGDIGRAHDFVEL